MIRKQALKSVVKALCCCLLLGACEMVPQFRGASMGPSFRPLSSDVAALAVPQPPRQAKPLYCRTGKGAVHVKKGWVDYQTADFVLESGGRSHVHLRTESGSALALLGNFDADGQKLIFCPVLDAPPEERIACSSIYALDDDLRMGIKRTFDVPDAVRGGAITCAYDRENLKKL